MKNQMKNVFLLGMLLLCLCLTNGLSAQADCDDNCIDWYLVVTDEYGRVLSETFLYTTCDGNESVSACETSGSEARIILTEDQASCEETWQLMVVMSHENNAMCGAYVKAMGRLTSKGGGNWQANAYLDKYVGAHVISGVCETAFYAIEDRSFVGRASNPRVAANFIAEVGFGINIKISDGSIFSGEGLVWFDAASINLFKDGRFQNPLCW